MSNVPAQPSGHRARRSFAPRVLAACVALSACQASERPTPPTPASLAELPPPAPSTPPADPQPPSADLGTPAPTTSSEHPTPESTGAPAGPAGPCPPGMALVEGGAPSKKQLARWKKFYPKAAPPPAEIAPFCLDLLETTGDDLVAAGEALLNKMRLRPSCLKRGDCTNTPLSYIHMTDAALYCAHKGKRMPTLVEWLWAAGGGTEDRQYPWGSERPTIKHLNGCDDACARAVMSDCSGRELETGKCELRDIVEVPGEDGYEERAPVGSYAAGAGRWGHLDLAGNVEEYVTGGDGVFFRCGGSYQWTRRLFTFSLHKQMCEHDDLGREPVSVRCAAAPNLGH